MKVWSKQKSTLLDLQRREWDFTDIQSILLWTPKEKQNECNEKRKKAWVTKSCVLTVLVHVHWKAFLQAAVRAPVPSRFVYDTAALTWRGATQNGFLWVRGSVTRRRENNAVCCVRTAKSKLDQRMLRDPAGRICPKLSCISWNVTLKSWKMPNTNTCSHQTSPFFQECANLDNTWPQKRHDKKMMRSTNSHL